MMEPLRMLKRKYSPGEMAARRAIWDLASSRAPAAIALEPISGAENEESATGAAAIRAERAFPRPRDPFSVRPIRRSEPGRDPGPLPGPRPWEESTHRASPRRVRCSFRLP